MESKVLKIRHWVATVVVLVALAGGALLSQGFKNWTGHTVFGAPGALRSQSHRMRCRLV